MCRTASSSTAPELQTTAWASRSQARSHGTSSRCWVAAALRLRRELTTTGTPTLRAIGTPSRYDQYRKQCTTSGEASRIAGGTADQRKWLSSTERSSRGSRSRTRMPAARAGKPGRPRLSSRSPSPVASGDPSPVGRICRSCASAVQAAHHQGNTERAAGRVTAVAAGRCGPPTRSRPRAAGPGPATGHPPARAMAT